MLAQGTVGAYLVSATYSVLLTGVNRDPGGHRRTRVCACGSFAVEQEKHRNVLSGIAKASGFISEPGLTVVRKYWPARVSGSTS